MATGVGGVGVCGYRRVGVRGLDSGRREEFTTETRRRSAQRSGRGHRGLDSPQGAEGTEIWNFWVQLSGPERCRVELAAETWTRRNRQKVREFKVKLAFSLSSIGVSPLRAGEEFTTAIEPRKIRLAAKASRPSNSQLQSQPI